MNIINMRPIKFRVWSNPDNKYLNYGNDASIDEYVIRTDGELLSIDHETGSCDVYRNLKGLIVERFTGHHDDGGTEIYEGDILLMSAEGSIWTYTVKNNEDFYSMDDSYDGGVEIIVVGNVHEKGGTN